MYMDMYACNGSKWLSDFAQNSIKTYTSPNPIQLIFLDIQLMMGKIKLKQKVVNAIKIS